LGSRVGSVTIDEDDVQEAVIRYWERLMYGSPVVSAPAWAKVVARNLARTNGRRRAAEARALQRVGRERTPGEVDEPPVIDEVRAAVARLPTRQRQIVILHYFGELSVVDVAAVTGSSVGTVKATLHHARRSLAARLSPSPIPTTKEKAMKPAHWRITGTHWQEYELALTDETLDGHRVAALRCVVDEPGGFGAQVQQFQADEYRGQRVRFSGRLRTENVSAWAGLWMRVDASDPNSGRGQLAFYNNEDRGLTGSTEWIEQDAVLDVSDDAAAILIGTILSGGGAVHIADLAVEVVGSDVPVTRQVSWYRPLQSPTNLGFGEVEQHDG